MKKIIQQIFIISLLTSFSLIPVFADEKQVVNYDDNVLLPLYNSPNTNIMKWVVNSTEQGADGTLFAFYKHYLHSLVNRYSLFIPTDEYFNNFIDPIAYSQEVPAALKFWYNNLTNTVNATVYLYNKSSGIVGDSVTVITDASFIKYRLLSILDCHIVNGDVETGDGYYLTNNYDIIRISGNLNNLKIKNGIDVNNSDEVNVISYSTHLNGNTYFIDKIIQPSLKSVYQTLSENSAFEKFFKLLINIPANYVSQVFVQQGVDWRVNIFNSYHYTLYVPTNEAVELALQQGRIKSWDEINSITDLTVKENETKKLVRNLLLHFQDKAVFFGHTYNEKFLSGTIHEGNEQTLLGTGQNKFLKIMVNSSTESMQITVDSKKGKSPVVANVLNGHNCYNNLIAKDFIFSRLPSDYKNVDGTGSTSGYLFTYSRLRNSSSAVLHQIDCFLTVE